MLNPDAVGPAIEVLHDDGEDVFYVEAHRILYNAIIALYRNNTPVDAVTLMEQLQKNDELDTAGGASYIAELTGAVPTSANIEYYAKIVMEKALTRKVISTCTRLAGDAYTEDDEVDVLLDRAESEIFQIAEKRQVNPIHKVADLLDDGIQRIEQQMKAGTGLTGIPSGYTKLDEMLSGFQPSDMVILAARPSVGKTAFSLNACAHAAVHEGKSVIFFSLEMAKEQLVQRLLCMEGRVDSSRLRSGFLAKAEFPKLQSAAAALNRANFFIDDTPNISVMELRSKARRHASQHPVDLMVIDYLQLMSGGSGRSESRQVEISEISRSVKGLARELSCPVIALSQLSREAERDDSGGPKLSHLRESGAIEQDADVVLMLSRPPAHEQEGRENIIRVNVAKQRNGPTGHVELLFEKNIQRFHNLGEGGMVPHEPVPDAAYEDNNFEYEESFEEDDMPF